MSSLNQIKLNSEQIAEFCKKHHILKLSFFGSLLREDFSSQSDVDVLVEFEPGYAPGFIRLAGIESELCDILGRKVDIRTKEDLSKYFRDEVLRTAETVYEER